MLAECNVRAKTGGEFDLAGFTTSRSGERLAYAVLIREIKGWQLTVSRWWRPRTPGLTDSGELSPEDAYPLTERLDPLLKAESYRGVGSGVLVS